MIPAIMLQLVSKLRINTLFRTNVISMLSLTCQNQPKRFFSSKESTCFAIPGFQNYLAYLEEEYCSLCERPSNDSNTNRRLSELQPIVDILNERKYVCSNLSSLEQLPTDELKDQEFLALVKEEQQIYNKKIEDLDLELQEVLIPVSQYDKCNNIVLEVTAGVGGQEAMLFAREIFDMYCGYADFKGWDSEIAQMDNSDLGGLRHASLLISGEKCFMHLQHEAGVHRVQRIPTTEKSGRVHTSTVSVATLPQPEEVDVALNDKDLRIETKRASGAGGQHVNTTDSAVRITHIPTGISVESQVDRSQIKNRQFAMQRLRALLFQQQLDQQVAETQATRKQQVGSSFRSEKIRTYNFNQDRITDHRVGGNIHNLRGFLAGAQPLDTLVQQLQQTASREKLMKVIEQFR